MRSVSVIQRRNHSRYSAQTETHCSASHRNRNYIETDFSASFDADTTPEPKFGRPSIRGTEISPLHKIHFASTSFYIASTVRREQDVSFPSSLTAVQPYSAWSLCVQLWITRVQRPSSAFPASTPYLLESMASSTPFFSHVTAGAGLPVTRTYMRHTFSRRTSTKKTRKEIHDP